MGCTRPIIIPGTRYGSLELTGIYNPSYTDGNKRIHPTVECKCDCGSITYKQLVHLTSGSSKSCGNKCPYYTHITHVLSRNKNSKNTKEYIAWTNMKVFCDDSNHRSYKYYGAKGITYHESLSTKEGFWNVMGAAPSKYHRFTRIDKEGDFEPGNIYWYLSDGKKKK